MAAQQGDTTWDIATIDTGSVGTKDVGRFSSLMLDPSRPTASKWCIAYEDTGAGKYVYAVQGKILNGTYKNGYSMYTVSASPKLGGYTSLAFDSSNRPAVSFYDSASSGLRFSSSAGDTFGGIAFTPVTVTDKGAVGYLLQPLLRRLRPRHDLLLRQDAEQSDESRLQQQEMDRHRASHRRPRDPRRQIQQHGRVHEFG